MIKRKHELRTQTRELALLRLDPPQTIRAEREEKFVEQSDVETRIIHAREKLLKREGFLLENDVNERSITHKLAQYLEEEFPGWDVDCEYNRVGTDLTIKRIKRLDFCAEQCRTDDTNAQTVYPDIIVHHRGEENENLLAIEAKKKSNHTDTGKDSGIQNDRRKLESFARDLAYQYCVLLIIDGCRVTHEFVKPKPPAAPNPLSGSDDQE